MIGLTITIETEWLLANDYRPEDFAVGREYVIVFTTNDGKKIISYLEPLESSLEAQLRRDDFSLLDGDDGYIARVSKIWPYLNMEIIKGFAG